jgi:hypothetical protein
MKKALIVAAVCEAATGLALLIAPSLVGQLLLGEELTGVAIPVARVTGIALIAFGIACWPGPAQAWADVRIGPEQRRSRGFWRMGTGKVFQPDRTATKA